MADSIGNSIPKPDADVARYSGGSIGEVSLNNEERKPQGSPSPGPSRAHDEVYSNSPDNFRAAHEREVALLAWQASATAPAERQRKIQQTIQQTDGALSNRWDELLQNKGSAESIEKYLATLKLSVEQRLAQVSTQIDTQTLNGARQNAKKMFSRQGLAQDLLTLEYASKGLLPTELNRTMNILKSMCQLPDQAAADKALVLGLRKQARAKLSAEDEKNYNQYTYDSLKSYFLHPNKMLIMSDEEEDKAVPGKLHVTEGDLLSMRVDFLLAYGNKDVKKDEAKTTATTTATELKPEAKTTKQDAARIDASKTDNRDIRDGVLSLYDGKSTDEKLELYRGNPDVEIALLSNSDVSLKGLQTLAQLPNLKNVQLSGLKISPEIIEELKTIPKLEELYLSLTDIDRKSLTELQNLKHLKTLSLTGASLKTNDWQYFAPPPQLETLSLADTTIRNKDMPTLVKQMPDLKRLDISDTGISAEGLAALTDCQKLESLTMRRYVLRNEEISALKALPLASLDLHDSNIDDGNIGKIVEMPKLRYLDIGATAVTDASKEQIKLLGQRPGSIIDLENTAISPAAYFEIRQSFEPHKVIHDFDKYTPERYAEEEKSRAAHAAELEKRFGLRFSTYEIKGVPVRRVACRPPLPEEQSVMEHVLNKGIMSIPTVNNPLAIDFYNRYMSLHGNYKQGQLGMCSDLSLKKYDGLAGCNDMDHHSFEFVFMHELAHKFHGEHPELYGRSNIFGSDYRNIPEERLKVIDELLGFKLVNKSYWILQGKDTANGAKTWYRHLSGGWASCDQYGQSIGNERLTHKQMQGLTKISFPTDYFESPNELMAEVMPILWSGGKAAEDLAADYPEIFALALAEDNLLIQSLGQSPGKKLNVRSLDGRLTTADEEYKKQMAAFYARVTARVNTRNAK